MEVELIEGTVTQGLHAPQWGTLSALRRRSASLSAWQKVPAACDFVQDRRRGTLASSGVKRHRALRDYRSSTPVSFAHPSSSPSCTSRLLAAGCVSRRRW